MLRKILPWLVFCILLALLVFLGFWQLHRAAEKDVLLVQYEARSAAQPLVASDLPSFEHLTSKEQESKLFSRVVLEGHFDSQHSVVMLNKIYQHQLGFHMMMPFLADGYDKPILVNLGWVPHPAQLQSKKVQHSYQELPTIPSIKGKQKIMGYIDYPKSGLTIGPAIAGAASWPLPMVYLDFVAFESAYHREIAHYVLLLGENEQIGFIRVWHPVTMSPARHIGYAVQWFALSFTLVMIPVVLRLRRRKKGVK